LHGLGTDLITTTTAVATATLPRFVVAAPAVSLSSNGPSPSSSLRKKRSHDSISLLNGDAQEEEEEAAEILRNKFPKMHDGHVFPTQSSSLCNYYTSTSVAPTTNPSPTRSDEYEFSSSCETETIEDVEYYSSSSTTSTYANSGTTSPLYTTRTISEYEEEVRNLNRILDCERRAHMLREGSIREGASKEISELKSQLKLRDELLASIFNLTKSSSQV
jgi:hypothetical protein